MGDTPQDPSTLATLHPAQGKDLAFKSYRTSPRLQGSHRMALTRPSRLPESGREYAPGDPIGLIDWKAFARTDQLIIREIRDEATARVRIVLDASESMQWPRAHVDLPRTVVSKAEIACRCALNLAYTHHRLGDLVEIWPLLPGQAVLGHAVRPRSGSDIVSLHERLVDTGFDPAALTATGRTEPEPDRQADLLYWVGDALGPVDPFARLEKGRVPVLVHVLSSLELGVDWVEGDTSYFDESALAKEYQGQMLRFRDAYGQSLERWRSRLETRVLDSGGQYGLVSDTSKIARWQGFVSSLPGMLRQA
jgi:uncharacterized protein (DUF58 family)